jgi:vesicle-associated membrane protein 7
VHGEVEQVKDVMVTNIGNYSLLFVNVIYISIFSNDFIVERVLARGERIELLVNKTDNLNQQAFAFRKRSTALRVCNHISSFRYLICKMTLKNN